MRWHFSAVEAHRSPNKQIIICDRYFKESVLINATLVNVIFLISPALPAIHSDPSKKCLVSNKTGREQQCLRNYVSFLGHDWKLRVFFVCLFYGKSTLCVWYLHRRVFINCHNCQVFRKLSFISELSVQWQPMSPFSDLWLSFCVSSKIKHPCLKSGMDPDGPGVQQHREEGKDAPSTITKSELNHKMCQRAHH